MLYCSILLHLTYWERCFLSGPCSGLISGSQDRLSSVYVELACAVAQSSKLLLLRHGDSAGTSAVGSRYRTMAVITRQWALVYVWIRELSRSEYQSKLLLQCGKLSSFFHIALSSKKEVSLPHLLYSLPTFAVFFKTTFNSVLHSRLSSGK
jgi:hypothetical protein